ncbi:MAG: PaaI family thioesterase [Acidobacteriota bacterium]
MSHSSGSERRPFSETYATLESLHALSTVWNASPPMERLGARLAFQRVDRVRAVLDPVQGYHRGGIGTDAVNGAVLAGLFDLVIGTVGWLSRPDARSATVSLSMLFLRPTRGDLVVAEARLLRAGMNLMFAAAEISGEDGAVTARCDGTVALARGKTTGEDFSERMRGKEVES